MTIDDVSNILGFLGGLGMFLYGMKPVSYTHLTLPTTPYV